MSRVEIGKMATLLEVRQQRSASAERALQAARRAVEASQRVRDAAEATLVRTNNTRDDELNEIKRGLMTSGRRGTEMQSALLYVRQLDAKARAAEVDFTRTDGELARALQQAEMARYEALDMRVREEKARHLLERSKTIWARRHAAREQLRLEGAHEAVTAAERLLRSADRMGRAP